ncbi:MAG: methyltransferase domain-containing protein, partial [Stellaceae bacterium]
MSGAPRCRFCDAPLQLSLVDLGRTPLANGYLTAEQLGAPEPAYPLHVRVCGDCRLVQLETTVDPGDIFSHYLYFSSYARSWVEHTRRFSDMARARWHLGPRSRVIEIASNDGCLLRHFMASGVPVLGIEPAANVAEVARAAGVPTEVAFFGLDAARRLKEEGRAADLVIGNNVLAHVPDINDFVAGLAHILKPDGVVSVEFPHLLRLLAEVQFDTIYHEHYSYLSLHVIERVFAAHGLRVFDVEEIPTHGGSLRVMACLAKSGAHAEAPGLQKVRRDEFASGLDGDAVYVGFERKVHAAREALLAFLHRARGKAKRVAAYGAAAKGNTLLNYCGIDAGLVAYAVDR